MNVKDSENENALKKQIQIYQEEFDVVLITERFHESLIIMKEELCWDIHDITFLKVFLSVTTQSAISSYTVYSRQ